MSRSDLNLLEFEADIDAFARHLDIDFKTAIKRIVIDVHDRIVERTPVDTGRARASWGIEADDVGDYVAPEDTLLSSEEATRTARDQQSVLAGDFEMFTVWWIFNNLQYIQALEAGHSGQAPVGMVGLALAEIESEILGIMS